MTLLARLFSSWQLLHSTCMNKHHQAAACMHLLIPPQPAAFAPQPAAPAKQTNPLYEKRPKTF
eukprot:scaffold86395_cov12-Tisochrysis_lutea.AAC.1